jgi:hypothetical protein
VREANVLWSSLLAAGAFVLFFLVFDFGLIWSLALSAFTLTAGLFLFRSKRPEVAAVDNANRKALAEGVEKQREIVALAGKIHNKAVVVKVNAIVVTVAKVLQTVTDDSDKISQARQFLGYYLDTVVRILTIYVDLESKGIAKGDILDALVKAEASLDTIRSAFENQLTKLLTGEVTDLDAELEMLQKSISMEGLGPTRSKE